MSISRVASTPSFQFLVLIIILNCTWIAAAADQTCAGIQLNVAASGCSGPLYYYSKAKPRVNAKTVTPVKALVAPSGRAAGITSTCDVVVSPEFIQELLDNGVVCSGIMQSSASAVKTLEANLKKLLATASNKHSLQSARLPDIKKAYLTGDMLKARRYNDLERLATIDYLTRTKTATLSLAKQIDAAIKTGAKVSGGAEAQLRAIFTKIEKEKIVLQASVSQQVKRLQAQAKQNQARAAQCGKGAAPGKGKRGEILGVSRMVRQFSEAPMSSLEMRAAAVSRTPLDGPRAPPAPTCPVKNATKKQVVKRSQVKEKPAPKKTPRKPKTQPKPKAPSPKKQVVKRPANRARRTPGKQAPRKRVTPKQKPKKVPKPTRRPKGTARRRRGRR
ncbi:hypothetical protein BKA62DRAFT_831496 [Auriculariales sp. MPI-PUGE-AT-0066]|nr:hypothetical protein BKA62DRAFT_831496 [Auriculariales sp. MPI-PUGE-AT-0066]